uniref:NAD-dependent protein deacylase n=1 Tax=Timema californicum TaxID=61474 RepID=A0A7R9JB19_TIMCA|nr:unnamed protein product [Timema californicum]
MRPSKRVSLTVAIHHFEETHFCGHTVYGVSFVIDKTADDAKRIMVRLQYKCSLHSLAFVPKHNPADEAEIEKLKHFLKCRENICVLTGAGISTESGIPDYRSEEVGLYARNTNKPVQYQDFVRSDQVRKRYWARNYIGWPRFSSFRPNQTHLALYQLEVPLKRVSCVITQNVDRLHHKAGSRNVLELHGTAFHVMCLGCDNRIYRNDFQTALAKLNPNMTIVSKTIRPDGDVELSQEEVGGFEIPSCAKCGGILKPDIVFFGDNVPRTRLESVRRELERSDSLLVLGSSLSVFSGYRIVLQARELDKPIAIVNIGATRGDKLAHIKISAKCGEVLPKLCESRINIT